MESVVVGQRVTHPEQGGGTVKAVFNKDFCQVVFDNGAGYTLSASELEAEDA